jgi:low-affinity ferrous iron transport protein
MLKRLVEIGEYEKVKPTQFHELQQTEFASKLLVESWLGRISTAVSAFLGHIATVFAFWVGIFIWIGFGHGLLLLCGPLVYPFWCGPWPATV